MPILVDYLVNKLEIFKVNQRKKQKNPSASGKTKLPSHTTFCFQKTEKKKKTPQKQNKTLTLIPEVINLFIQTHTWYFLPVFLFKIYKLETKELPRLPSAET